MKMLEATEKEMEPLKWRFYDASDTPDVSYLDLHDTNRSFQVEGLSLGEQVNGDLGTMHHSGLIDYDFSPGRASPRAPVKAVHDLSIMFPDTDSGFGSYKSRSRVMEDFSPTLTRLPRSRSLSRLNGLTTQEISEVMQEKPVRHIQTQLEDSEARRTVLMSKLKEAQATLELQNDRLSKIENSAKDNTVLVEDLKFKEREYRKKIAQLQAAEEEKQMLQLENSRLREEMQDRIECLDYQLKTLKSQHQSTEEENERRTGLLDQTTTALCLLEEENTRLQQDRDKLREEMGLMKEAFQLSKSRFESLEGDYKSQKNETERLREENLSLNKRVHEMAGQMMELRSLLQAVKDDNERLSSSWQSASDDKHRASRQMEGYQDTLADLKSRLAAAVADKDRLFQERLDLNHKVQQLILEKEQLLKSQMVLEEQVEDQHKALEKTHFSNSHHDNYKKHLEEELSAVKRVSEDLSTELASVKAFYERALEQLSLAENSKKLQEQQVQLAEQERKRLQREVDRLAQILDGRHRDDRDERQHLEDTILKMRSEIKDVKYDKEQLANKCHELEAKLRKANDEIRGGLGKQHEDLETWKTTCDRLTASVTRKETELQNLSDKCHDLENQLSRVREDLRHSRENEEISTSVKEELERLRDENRRLLQEKAENEQMLQLLETQRDVLTKSTESSLSKLQDVEQLSGKVDQMRNENELLRQRISELEKVRDNLVKQKEELLANSELVYKSQGFEELEGKMEELREANKQLRDINEVMSSKLQIVEQENLRLKHAMSDGSSKEDLKRLREENTRLLEESNRLRKENQDYVAETCKETESSSKEMQKMRKERDALQKQVQLINGQLSLMEGSKKRSDDTAQRMQDELAQLRSKLETSRKECAEAKRVAAQVTSLSEQLQKAKDKQESQEKLIRTMKEELEEERSKKPARIQESLEDVGAELQQMSGELHKLMREIENKEQTIESLEKELRTARDTADAKEHTVNDLKKLVSELEQQNATLKTSLEMKPMDSSGDERPLFVMKSGEKSLKEELEEAVKSKHTHFANKKGRTVVRSKSMIPVKIGESYQARLTFTQPNGASEQGPSEEKTSMGGMVDQSVFDKPPVSVTSMGGKVDQSEFDKPPVSVTSMGGKVDQSVFDKPPVSVNSMGGKVDQPVFDKPPVSVATAGRTVPTTATPKTPALPPLVPTSDPSPTGSDKRQETGSAVISAVQSCPTRPSKPADQFSLGNRVTKAGGFHGDKKADQASLSETPPSTEDDAAAALLYLILEAAKSAPDQLTDPAASDLSENKEPVQTDAAESSDGGAEMADSKDTVDFPPLTPPPVEHTKPKLAFARPQPAAKTKPRKLPQIRVTVTDEGAARAKKTAETEEGKARSGAVGNGAAKAQAATLYSIKKKLQASPAPKVLAPAPRAPAKPRTSPRESRKTFISRRELSGKPSKLLSDSGVTVIATKTGSSQNASTDVKYVVKKQESPTESKASVEFLDSSGTSQSADSEGSLIKSFDELLGSNGSTKSSGSSEFRFVSEKVSSSEQMAPQPKSETAISSSDSSAKARSENASRVPDARPQSLSKVPARIPSTSGSEQTTPTKAAGAVQAKSSIKDFLAAFSPAAEKKEQGLERQGSAKSMSEDKKTASNRPVKPLLSRLSHSDDAVPSHREESPAKKSPSPDPFASLLDESILPDDDGDKEKEAESTSTLASGPTFSSSLASSDPWTLLLDEPGAKGTSSAGAMEASAGKATQSALKVRGAGEEEKHEGGLLSTASASSSMISSSSLNRSLEEGQPLKFKPATGLFLSKSLGHPISALTSSQSQHGVGAGGDSEPEKAGSESGDRLQSLISKYRSHSSDPPIGASSPVGGAKSRGSSAPPAVKAGLGSPRGRGFIPGAPKAPLLRPESASSSGKSDEASSSKTGKKLPPPPPPKPGKSLLKSLPLEGGARAEGPAGELLDSQEQSDINALIQKQAGGAGTPTKSLLSVHPPKITSKVIAGLLLRNKKLS